jgi:glutamate dehydrogenase
VVNDMVNHGGITFVYRATEETGAALVDIVRAYAVMVEVFELRDIWAEADALDNKAPTEAQLSVFAEGRRVIDRGVRWLVQSRSGPIDVEAEIARLKPGLDELLPQVPSLCVGKESAAVRAQIAEQAEHGVPLDLATRSTTALYGFGLLDVVELAQRMQTGYGEVAETYYTVSERFRMDDLLERISLLPRGDRWHALARMALRYDLYAALGALTSTVLKSVRGEMSAEERMDAWTEANAGSLARALNMLNLLPEDVQADLATLSVVLRQIRTVVRASAGSAR